MSEWFHQQPTGGTFRDDRNWRPDLPGYGVTASGPQHLLAVTSRIGGVNLHDPGTGRLVRSMRYTTYATVSGGYLISATNTGSIIAFTTSAGSEIVPGGTVFWEMTDSTGHIFNTYRGIETGSIFGGSIAYGTNNSDLTLAAFSSGSAYKVQLSSRREGNLSADSYKSLDTPAGFAPWIMALRDGRFITVQMAAGLGFENQTTFRRWSVLGTLQASLINNREYIVILPRVENNAMAVNKEQTAFYLFDVGLRADATGTLHVQKRDLSFSLVTRSVVEPEGRYTVRGFAVGRDHAYILRSSAVAPFAVDLGKYKLSDWSNVWYKSSVFGSNTFSISGMTIDACENIYISSANSATSESRVQKRSGQTGGKLWDVKIPANSFYYLAIYPGLIGAGAWPNE